MANATSRTSRHPVQYASYLQLEQLLSCQQPESGKDGEPAHDELLFIITHQAYELWFKQILHELDSVVRVFSKTPIDDKQMGAVIHRLSRVKSIQRLLLMQIDVLETMTPLDFLEFRDLLIPASGFQSLQFKRIEIVMGLKSTQRIPEDQGFLRTRLSAEEQARIAEWENGPNLFELTERWLARMPFLKFGSFDFWSHYEQAVERMLSGDRAIIESNLAVSESHRNLQLEMLEVTRGKLKALLDGEQFEALRRSGDFRLSHAAFLAALFIHLYRDEPMMYLPFRYLTLLAELDGLWTTWRARHVLMVQRMLGTKIGTGGSAGHAYLSRTTEQNRMYLDLFNIATFLLPRSALPPLPDEVHRAMGFQS